VGAPDVGTSGVVPGGGTGSVAGGGGGSVSSDPSEVGSVGVVTAAVDVLVVDASVDVCVVVDVAPADVVDVDVPLGPGPLDDVPPEVDDEGGGGGGAVVVVVVVAVVVDVAV